MNLREACLRYDLEMAIHRGLMNNYAVMQLELNDLTPEQNAILMQNMHLAPTASPV